MNSRLDVLTGTQIPQIQHLPADVHSLAVAEECIELAEAYGPSLDESQRITLRAWMGTRADGTWSARDCVHAMSRQNGKGDELQARELYGLTVIGEPMIHTAHELETSKNAHLRLVSTFENYDDLRRLVSRVTYGNGDQGIELRSGAFIKYRARTGGGGRGLDDIGVVVYDEAQHLKPEHVAASSPTIAVHPNPQLFFTGSAGLSFSEMWWKFRLNALAGKGARLAYLEHTAERCGLDSNGRFFTTGADVNSIQSRADANPAYNTRITDEFLESQLQTMGPELFAREHLGVWDIPSWMQAQAGAKIPEAAWMDTATAAFPTVTAGDLVMAYDVELDGSFSAIGIATGTLADAFVQNIEHRPGVGWLPGRLVELVKRWNPSVVLMDGGSGAAAAALGEIREAFEQARISPELLVPLTSAQYRAACGAFVQAVIDGKVHRPEVENDRLHKAGLTARERTIGDSWLFDRRNSPEPVVSLTSAVMARSRLAEPVEVGGFVDLNDFDFDD